jgi:photosystem II stability/assembly factor-like uncharacterized protein/TolA-binding protein
MRTLCVALLAGVVLAPAAAAADLRFFEDAAVRAVQFVDEHEGWAAGDDGVVWHSIDGGRTWERQPTGVRASLRSVCFLDPYTGWVAGREELPHGGSLGVLLVTRDGGLKWQRVAAGSLPGLNGVRFTDAWHGLAFGDGTDQFPTGLFQTADGGRTWQPLPGARTPSWLAAHFLDANKVLLAGAWGRLAVLRQGSLGEADIDAPGGRSIHALAAAGKRAFAAGQGGLVVSADAAGRWGYAPLPFAAELQANCDFHAVAVRDEHVWVAGRPGSVVLHSADGGGKWELQPTGQALPLHGLFFLDARRGWAVGELGTILRTEDGGKTWQAGHRGGRRAAVLFVHARPAALSLDTVAQLGVDDGYLTAAVRVAAADPASATPDRAADGPRLSAAMRQTGGAAGELLWQFPVTAHAAGAPPRTLLAAWDRLHADGAADQLLRQLVLALRVWRPDVVLTDHPDAVVSGSGADALVAEAVREAFQRAADPRAYPEQLQPLGLALWKPSKLYACWDGHTSAQVVLDTTANLASLEGAPREFATPAAGLLSEPAPTLPPQRFYRLLASRIDGAEAHRHLLQGVPLSPSGDCRRPAAEVKELSPELTKALRNGRNLVALAESPPDGLSDPNRLLAGVGPALAALPDDRAARAAFRIASQFARTGQWLQAREVFLLLVDRYPAHPVAADAYRWLIQYNTSSEARRRHETNQYRLETVIKAQAPVNVGGGDDKPNERGGADATRDKRSPRPKLESLKMATTGGVDMTREQQLTLLGGLAEAREWYQGSLKLAPRLAAFGPVLAGDPSLQFCLNAARRQLGDVETARQWYARFRSEHPSGPWSDNAAAELWLANRAGLPPKTFAACRQTSTPPYLDGQLDDPCWQGKPFVLRNAVGDTLADYPTEVWLAYDKDFLYLALRCKHPSGRQVAAVKGRSADADLRPYDRVGLLLDLDRDYVTYFHLQVDQRGCVCDDCWGDRSWNPRWFVALHSDATAWQVEAAIPMAELTGENVTVGKAWACNVVRVLPGRGVQAWSLPADVEPRPEGLGLLIFAAENKRGE